MLVWLNPGTGGAVVFGLSTDAKPASIPNGWLFIETDTGKHYLSSAGAWAVVAPPLSLSPSVGIGYATGAGGAVVQATSKATGVTLNTVCGTITLNAAALAAGAIVTFTVTDSAVAATDVIVAQHDSVGTIGGYTITPNTPAAGSFKISVRNNTAGSLSEAMVIRFAVIKAVAS